VAIQLKVGAIDEIKEIEFLLGKYRETKYSALLAIQNHCSGVTIVARRMVNVTAKDGIIVLFTVVWIGLVAKDLKSQRVSVLVEEFHGLSQLVGNDSRFFFREFENNVGMFHA
jgi:hypothetical protein